MHARCRQQLADSADSRHRLTGILFLEPGQQGRRERWRQACRFFLEALLRTRWRRVPHLETEHPELGDKEVVFCQQAEPARQPQLVDHGLQDQGAVIAFNAQQIKVINGLYAGAAER